MRCGCETAVRADRDAALGVATKLVPGHRRELGGIVACELGDCQRGALARVPSTDEDLDAHAEPLERREDGRRAAKGIVERDVHLAETRERANLPQQQVRLDAETMLPGGRDGVVTENEGSQAEAGPHWPQIDQPISRPTPSATAKSSQPTRTGGTARHGVGSRPVCVTLDANAGASSMYTGSVPPRPLKISRCLGQPVLAIAHQRGPIKLLLRESLFPGGSHPSQLFDHLSRQGRGLGCEPAGPGGYISLQSSGANRLERPEVGEDAGGDALPFANEPEQDVFRPDVGAAVTQGLAQRELEHLLGARREGNLPGRHHFVALAHDPRDLRAHLFMRDVKRIQSARRCTVLSKQAEQDVLGADVVVPQRAGLVLRQHDHLSSRIAESLEHLLEVNPPPPRRALPVSA